MENDSSMKTGRIYNIILNNFIQYLEIGQTGKKRTGMEL